MNWIRLSAEDLESVLNNNQLALLKSEYAKKTDRDFVKDILDSTVALVRAHIAASGVNMLDIDHSRIPPELRECALRLALEKLQSRIPAFELTKIQERQSDYARGILEKVGSGAMPVCRPFAAVRTANPKKGISASRGSSNPVNRKSMEGI